MFRSVRGSDSGYIGNQLLYFHEMTLSKPISAQEGGPHHKMAPRPQKWPELAKKHLKLTPNYHVPLC